MLVSIIFDIPVRNSIELLFDFLRQLLIILFYLGKNPLFIFLQIDVVNVTLFLLIPKIVFYF